MTTAQLLRIALKTCVLFLIVNALWVVVQPLPLLEAISLAAPLVEGRARLPYGLSSEDYNLSPTRLGTMFATHEIRRPKAADEFRVVMLGDSSVWGILLRPDETLTAQLNARHLTTEDGRRMVFYNLAYPMNSVLKDQLILDEALRYQPDQILWFITLESLAYDNQLEPPLLQANPALTNALIAADHLPLAPLPDTATLWDQTLIGQRRLIADWLRLQFYGLVWTTTGIDQIYKDYTPRSNDFDTDVTWHGYTPDNPPGNDEIGWAILRAGLTKAQAQNVPVLFVNEPVYEANGTNSDVHYNAWSPRWMYNAYRDALVTQLETDDMPTLDAWNVVPPAEFTDSPVHLTPNGSSQFADWLVEALPTQATR